MPECGNARFIDGISHDGPLRSECGGLVRTSTSWSSSTNGTGRSAVELFLQVGRDPVEGGGSYVASRKGARETEVTLSVQVRAADHSPPCGKRWAGRSCRIGEGLCRAAQRHEIENQDEIP